MAQQLTQLTVFFSGTSEMEAERAALRKVVEELNRVLETSRQITIKVISWPDDFRPGVNEDPQSEINRQVGKYDIYFGVLGSRFGTQTTRASSGTEEEFNIALSQFLKDTTSVRVLFYFKVASPDLYSIDTEQLQKVQEFRATLGKQGVVYMDFKDTPKFVEMAKKHLLDLIEEEWENSTWCSVELLSTVPNSKTTTDEDADGKNLRPNNTISEIVRSTEEAEEELGYFELIEEFHKAVNSMTSEMADIAKYTSEIGAQFTTHTDSVNELMEKYGNRPKIGGSRDAQKYLTKAKNVINGAADDLNAYTQKMAPQISAFKADLAVMLNRFRDVYIFSRDQLEVSEEQKKEDIGALREFVKTMEGVVSQITAFQDTVRNLPALTTKLKKSQKRASAALGELIAEIKLAIEYGNDIISGFSG